MPLPPRKKYGGRSRRLLLAFDIGTTFSGISYSILDPGKEPVILPVTRFPFQEAAGADSKIPTVVYYDKDGKPRAIGAETLKENVQEEAEEEGWSQARWFKLHLRPKPTSVLKMWNSDPLPPLPPNKAVGQIFGDYMRYLYQCAREYITETETNGDRLWTTLKDDAAYVFTHPNGWGGNQQADMRRSAVRAGLIEDTEEGRARISFVTEGEASLHFCLANGLSIGDEDSKETGAMIVDAGGGTIDFSSYRRLPDGSFEEISIPKCHFQGAAYVTMRAERHFRNLLAGSKYVDDVDTLTARFDRQTKHMFKDEDEVQPIQFAGRGEKNEALKIRGGRLQVPGRDVAQFFQPSVDCIVEAIKLEMLASHFPIKSVFLVGGFSASHWLFNQVKKKVQPWGVSVSRPDSHVNKAVSNGAVSFSLDHFVSTRVSRLTYGTFCATPYDASDSSHRSRVDLARKNINGERILTNYFSVILPKDTRVTETTEFKSPFIQRSTDKNELKSISAEVFGYTGQLEKVSWLDDDPDMFPVVCTVEADTSAVKLEELRSGATGSTYYRLEFEIILLFGLTELQAQIAWEEDGIEKRGPARVAHAADRKSVV